jgi:hypothetical protein
MKSSKIRPALAITVAMAGGVVIGAIGHALHAQSKPPIYMIGNIEITNEEGYSKEYLPPARKSILDHGGVYIAAGKGIPATSPGIRLS